MTHLAIPLRLRCGRKKPLFSILLPYLPYLPYLFISFNRNREGEGSHRIARVRARKRTFTPKKVWQVWQVWQRLALDPVARPRNPACRNRIDLMRKTTHR